MRILCLGFCLMKGLPGPYKTCLFEVPYYDFVIYVLKKVGLLGLR